MRNRIAKKIIVCLLVTLLQSCETSKVWHENYPDQYFEVVPEYKGQDVVKYLNETGEDYYCKDVSNIKTCYLKSKSKTRMEAVGAKIYKTPKALITDLGESILIIGYVVIRVGANGHVEGGI